MTSFVRESLGIWTTKTPRKSLCLGAFVVPFDQSLLSLIADHFVGFSLPHLFYLDVLCGNTFALRSQKPPVQGSEPGGISHARPGGMACRISPRRHS